MHVALLMLGLGMVIVGFSIAGVLLFKRAFDIGRKEFEFAFKGIYQGMWGGLIASYLLIAKEDIVSGNVSFLGVLIKMIVHLSFLIFMMGSAVYVTTLLGKRISRRKRN